ncbi:unnamed protein product, partial [Iphiclides podalirius]
MRYHCTEFNTHSRYQRKKLFDSTKAAEEASLNKPYNNEDIFTLRIEEKLNQFRIEMRDLDKAATRWALR